MRIFTSSSVNLPSLLIQRFQNPYDSFLDAHWNPQQGMRMKVDLCRHRGVVPEILIHVIDDQGDVFREDRARQAIGQRDLDLSQRLTVCTGGGREH